MEDYYYGHKIEVPFSMNFHDATLYLTTAVFDTAFFNFPDIPDTQN
jgi:hypothetical protein